MTAPDITAAAIDAAVLALSRHQWEPEAAWTAHAIHAASLSCAVCTADIPAIVAVALEAAVPVLLDSHEKQVREKIAGELRARVADITEMTGPRAARRRAFHAAANSVAPEPSLEEVAVAFARGDYAACYLDDAGQPIARGSRPAADGEASDGV